MARIVGFDDVTKRYPRGGPSYPSLRQEIADFVARARHRRPRRQGVLALDGLTFEVGEGESFAIVGPNGAGKTTCLKLISRISHPTSGKVHVRGRIGALIEAASGLHLELTGRENVWLYGRILGMSKRDIRGRFDEIVAFAELEDFLDTPVKMYSSGMQLRLGFAIASHLDPDVLLVDEALAVGDATFQARCAERMRALLREGRTLLFVSHDLHAVENTCTRALFLLGGRCEEQGPTGDVLRRYLTWVEEHRADLLETQPRGEALRVAAASCHDHEGAERYEFAPGAAIDIRLVFESDSELDHPRVSVGVSDGRPGVLIGCSMLADDDVPPRVGRRWECRLSIARLPLLPRLYHIYCDVYDGTGRVPLMSWGPVSTFRVVDAVPRHPGTVVHPATGGAVDVAYRWTVVSDAG